MKIVAPIFSLILCLTAWQALAQSSKKKAEDFAEAGWNYYYFAEFEKAEKMLFQAVDADPANHNLKYDYAKILMRNKKFAEAIKFLGEAEVKGKKAEEKNLMLGVANFAKENFTASRSYLEPLATNKGDFSDVAKNYLNKINEAGKRYTGTAQFGLMYDSRVIDEDLLTTTDGADGRVFAGGDILYRWKRVRKGQYYLRGEVANYFSFDDEHSLADPLKVGFSVPYITDISTSNKRYGLITSPGVEVLWLDIENTGDREHFLTSLVLDVQALEETDSDKVTGYFGSARLEMGSVDSLEDTTADVDGINLEGGWRRTNFLNKAKNRYWQVDGYGKIYLADGDDLKFYRAGGAGSYSINYKGWRTAAVGEAKYTLYPDNTGDSRGDINLAIAGVATRSVKQLLNNKAPQWLDKDWLNLEVRGGFSLNISNDDDEDYDQFVVSTLLKGNWKF